MYISIKSDNNKQFTYMVEWKLHPYLGETIFNSRARTDNSVWLAKILHFLAKTFNNTDHPQLTQ